MAKLDVIIPVYNVQKHLRKCLDSVLAQTLEDINIICVNDGSTDDSAEILKEYQQEDSRIAVVTQENQGLSAARNSGIKSSKNEFIMFLDSDDYYHPQMCEKMYNAIVDNNVDIAVCQVEVIIDPEYQNTEHEIANDWESYLKLHFEGKQDITNEIIEATNVIAWNKIYKRSIIEKHQIEFPKGLIFEDNPFFYSYMTVSENIFYLNEKLYYYFRHSDTIMAMALAKKQKENFDLILTIKYYYDFLIENNLYEQNKALFWFYFFKSFGFCFSMLDLKEKAEAVKICSEFLKQFKYLEFINLKKYMSKMDYKRLCQIKNRNIKRLKDTYVEKTFLINFKGHKFIRIK